jgi:hypothetical protein
MHIFNTEHHYQKWREYYESHVKNLFNYLLYELDKNDILFKNYDFEVFCRLVYNKSSKRIPLY